ncbi:DcrB-related protein [Enterobacteriaceae bacterium C23F]
MDNQRCVFTEGSITVPEGLTDRSINMLGDAQSRLPPINITRDYLATHQDLAGYIQQQVSTLTRQVSGWQAKGQRTISLGDNAACGILLNYSFLRTDGLRLMHQQAVFLLGGRQILVFTTMKGSPFSEADNRRFLAAISSFRPH